MKNSKWKKGISSWMIVVLIASIFFSFFGRMAYAEIPSESIQQFTSDEIDLNFIQKDIQKEKVSWQILIHSKNSEIKKIKLKITDDTGKVITTVRDGANIINAADDDGLILPASLEKVSFDTNSNAGFHIEVFTSKKDDGKDFTHAGSTDIKYQNTLTSSTLETDESAGTTEQQSVSEENESTSSSSEAAAATLPSSEENRIKPQMSIAAGPSAQVTGNPQVPKGAILLDGIFQSKPNAVGNSGSSGVNKIQSPDVNNGMPYSEVSLGGSKNWLSIWSNAQYRLNFSKSFHGRTYINFGQSGQNADGLAFVMQNAGPEALTSANNDADGQNLGVYGGTNAYRDSLIGPVKTPESFAIKQSVAVEFDLYTNNSGKTIYDKENTEIPHMAYSFPGNLHLGYKSDNLLGGDLWVDGNKAIVRHQSSRKLNGIVGDNIRDNTWYEFRYDFDETSKAFSYYLKNPVTGASTAPVTIPWNDLSRELNLSASNNKAYWGFTGSNGAANGQVKFVFTQVPVDLSANIENDVLSNGASIVDKENHDTYVPGMPAGNANTPVQFRTKFSVQQGEAALMINEWKTIVNPQAFDLSKGVSEVTATIGGTKITGTANINAETGEINVTFPNLKVSPGQQVNMEYSAVPIKKGQVEKSSFTSRVLTKEIGNGTAGDFMSNQVVFWIKANQPPVLSNLAATKPTFTDFIDAYQFKFNYKDEDSDVLTYRVWINGKEYLTNQHLIGTPTDQLFQTNNKTTIDLLKSDTVFKVGENTLKVELSDGQNPAVIQETSFMIDGYYGFEELSGAFTWSYARANLPEEEKPMPRDGDMKIKIRDTRGNNSSNTSKVAFSAKSGDELLTTENFYFGNQNLDSLSFPINKEVIYSKDQGLLLKMDNSHPAEKAAGTATWTILDAP